jgi:hypothetical protein
VFTNTEGKRVTAEVVGADETSVTMKLDGGQLTRVPLASLSGEDQAYIAKWLKDSVPSLSITPKFVRANRNKDTNGNKSNDGQQMQVFNLSVEVFNEDKSRALEDCEARYVLVGRSLEDRGLYKVLSVQTVEFSLDAEQRTTLPFKEVQNFYEDSSRRSSGHRGVGYVLQIKRKADGREVFLRSDTPLLEKAAGLIAALPERAETDETFMLAPGSQDNRDKKDNKKDGPIIIR